MISAPVGAGKSLYHKLFEELLGMVCNATAILNRQIFHEVTEKVNDNNLEETTDVSMMLSGIIGNKAKQVRKFRPRHMLRNPGTKEG